MDNLFKNKLFILLFFSFIILIVFASVSSAKSTTQTISLENRGLVIEYPKLTTIKLNDSHTWRWKVYNSTDGVVKSQSSSVSCDAGINMINGDYKGNHTMFQRNVSFDTETDTFYLYSNPSNFSDLGQYSLSIECKELEESDPNNLVLGGFASIPFYVTPNGKYFTDAQSIGSLGIMGGIISLVFFFLIISMKMMDKPTLKPLGLFFFTLSVFLSLYSLQMGLNFSVDVMAYESLYNLQSTIYTVTLWLVVFVAIISAILMVFGFVREFGRGKMMKDFGEGFDPISQTYQ